MLDIKRDGPDQTIAHFPPGLYSARISVLPQSTLFAFITALLLSLLVCSVMANVEERVEDERLQARGGAVDDHAPLFRAVPGRARTCCARLPERALSLVSVGGAVLLLILVIDVLRIELLGLDHLLVGCSVRLPARWAICRFRRGLLRGLTRGPGRLPGSRKECCQASLRAQA